MSSELYVQIPARYGDLSHAAPGSPLLALMKCPGDTGFLLNLHLQAVLYSKTWRLEGLIPEGALMFLAYPHLPAAALRDIQHLVEAGYIQDLGDHEYLVPAAVEWAALRVGTRDLIPESVRTQVYERDGWRCVECGSRNDLTVDHILPWSKDGPDDEANLRTLCGFCNSSKGARV